MQREERDIEDSSGEKGGEGGRPREWAEIGREEGLETLERRGEKYRPKLKHLQGEKVQLAMNKYRENLMKKGERQQEGRKRRK